MNSPKKASGYLFVFCIMIALLIPATSFAQENTLELMEIQAAADSVPLSVDLVPLPADTLVISTPPPATQPSHSYRQPLDTVIGPPRPLRRYPTKKVNIVDSIVYEPIDLRPNPYLLPPIYKGEFHFDKTIHWPPVLTEPDYFPILKDESYSFSPHPYLDSLRLSVHNRYMSENPTRVRYKRTVLEQIDRTQPEVEINVFRRLFEVEADADFNDVEKIKRFKPKRRYWKHAGSSFIQFSQSYLSDNWYKKGNDNLTLLSTQKFSTNYARGKVKFNNSFEWKLNFYTIPNDSLSFRIGEDLFRYYGDFGYEAFNNKWSYSTNLEVKTQILKNYKDKRKTVLNSSFLSPVYINMGVLGMKYSLNKTFANNKDKKLTLSADVSPLSVEYRYVHDDMVDPTRYGIEKGKKDNLTLGSKIVSRLSVSFNKQISLTSRFQYFSNFEKVILESENELNLSLNRYLSTRLYVYGRFDDSKGIKKDDKLGYFQLSELLSFGISITW